MDELELVPPLKILVMSEKNKLLISVVVPFLNEEQNLPILYERVRAVLCGITDDWELLLVDDGSSDGSVPLVRRLAAADNHVRLLRLSRNFGHQIAITAGLDHARGEAVIIMDADLQDPPEVMKDLLEKWRAGYEVVYAVRSKRDGETWLKKFLAASFYKVFQRMSKVKVPLDAGDFRLVDHKVVAALKEVRELHRFMRGLTCWVGFSQTAVYYERAARLAGETKYPVIKSLRLAIDAITSFSGAPLRMMMGLGVLVGLCGVWYALRGVYYKIFHPETLTAGWTSVIAWLLLVGGMQLFGMGLVGQYVSRIYEETKKRPLYFVREEIN